MTTFLWDFFHRLQELWLPLLMIVFDPDPRSPRRLYQENVAGIRVTAEEALISTVRLRHSTHYSKAKTQNNLINSVSPMNSCKQKCFCHPEVKNISASAG